MAKQILIYLAGMISLFILMILLLISLWVFDEGSIKIDDTLYSPSGEYKAIVYTFMGGGGFGYCYKSVAILTFSSPDPLPNGQQNYTFSSGCSTLVSIVWMGNASAEITYSSLTMTSAMMDLNESAQKGRVLVSYKRDT
ncbi:MAG: hypothetical protein ACJAWT_000783 [Glaciecola sp.]|jgi:hypothetical protein